MNAPPSEIQIFSALLISGLLLGALLYYKVRASRKRLFNSILLLTFGTLGLWVASNGFLWLDQSGQSGA